MPGTTILFIYQKINYQPCLCLDVHPVNIKGEINFNLRDLCCYN